MIMQLMRTGLGCWWLLELWSELRASFENHGWRAPERFRAFRLLAIHPSDAYMTIELGSILQACQALDPEAGSLVGEVWNELVPASALPALEAMYQREIANKPTPGPDEARQYLLEIIKRETSCPRGEGTAARGASGDREGADAPPDGIRRQPGRPVDAAL